MNATIYDMHGNTITEGVQSSTVCDQAINMAREIAKERGRSVIVEDGGSGEVYRITPSGLRWKPPAYWADWPGHDD